MTSIFEEKKAKEMGRLIDGCPRCGELMEVITWLPHDGYVAAHLRCINCGYSNFFNVFEE